MVYKMEFYASSTTAMTGPAEKQVLVATSVAVLLQHNGKTRSYRRAHFSTAIPAPSEAGAAVHAIYLSLEKAWERSTQLTHKPKMEIIIRSDHFQALNLVQNFVGYCRGLISMSAETLLLVPERIHLDKLAQLDTAMISQEATIVYEYVDADDPAHPAVRIAKEIAVEHLQIAA
jgi:hypothetical protein